MQFIKKHPILLLIITIVILVILIIVTKGNRNISTPEDLVGTVVTPVQGAVSSVTGGIGEWFKGLFGQSTLQKENAELKEKLRQLEGQLSLTGELQQENERLREIANYHENNPQYEMVTARVIGKNPGYWFDTFTINVGRSDGIEQDMVAITPEGLVGRVMEVGNNWSKVISIADSRSSVSGMIERTRDNGVVRGSTEADNTLGGRCQMYYLPFENDLVPGDKVLTSGLGGVFPKGIVIGEVIEVSRAQGETERTAVIDTAVDFTKLEEVMIIKTVIEAVN